MKERDLQQEILLNASTNRVRLWRNNRGVFKVDDRYISTGLGGNGGADLVGIRAVKITPGMVGKTIGQFVALEVKTDKGKVSPEQYTFVCVIKSLGGMSGVIRPRTYDKIMQALKSKLKLKV